MTTGTTVFQGPMRLLLTGAIGLRGREAFKYRINNARGVRKAVNNRSNRAEGASEAVNNRSNSAGGTREVVYTLRISAGGAREVDNRNKNSAQEN